MNFLDTPLMTQLESLLSVTSTRQGVIASNLANADTPGYQTRDVDFAQAMAQAEQGLDPANALQTVSGLVARPDGNNVSVDREQMLMAQTQLQFSAGAALLREEFSRISMAINGGGGERLMNLFGVLDISASALLAERQRAEVVTSNLANADSSATPGASVYQRQEVVFQSEALPFAQQLAKHDGVEGAGVAVTQVLTDSTAPVRRYEPGSANADAEGYVDYPDIDPVREMTDLMEAARSYQMNASAVDATKNMIQQSIGILRS